MRELERVMEETEELWEKDERAREVRAFDPEGETLKEYMEELRVGQVEVVAVKEEEEPSIVEEEEEEEESSEEEEAESSAEETDLDTDEDIDDFQHREKSSSTLQQRPPPSTSLPVPVLPSLDTVFPSVNAAYCAYVVALVPTTGISVFIRRDETKTAQLSCMRSHNSYSTKPGGLCPFHVVLSRSDEQGGWVIDPSRTHLEHNHGPHPCIIDDPAWRPRVVNKHAKQALADAAAGRRPAWMSGKRRRAKSSSATEAPPSPPPRKRPRPASPPLKPAAAAAFSVPSLQSHFPSASSVSSLDHPIASSTTALLTSLHPSLAPLTPHLLAAGVDSPDSLVELALLDPHALELFVDTIRRRSEDERWRPRGAERISVLQARLLVKGLRREGQVEMECGQDGWSV
ncbi:hypothetical protein JCM6882_003253 [Rhodosporidiobolus microsporus]